MKYVIEIPETDSCWSCQFFLVAERAYECCAVNGMNLEELDFDTSNSKPKSCPLMNCKITERTLMDLRDARSQLHMLSMVMLAEDKQPIWECISSRCVGPISKVLTAIEGQR